MQAYQLLAKLRVLSLAGFENGQFIWVGTDKQWDDVKYEEESILRDAELAKI